MQNGHGASRDLGRAVHVALREAEHVGAHLGRIDTIVTAVQSQDELAEDAPDEALGSSLTLVLQVLDHTAEVAVAAILHVQVEILADLEMLAVVVGDNVWVPEMRKDLEFGVKLLALLLGHAQVRNLFAAHNEAVILAAHLADDAKRAMACEVNKKFRVSHRGCLGGRVVVVVETLSVNFLSSPKSLF